MLLTTQTRPSILGSASSHLLVCALINRTALGDAKASCVLGHRMQAKKEMVQMIENGGSLAYLQGVKLPDEDLAYFHSMDISASVYNRMKELGLSKSELAKRMNVFPAQITEIIKGNQNLTLKTIAELENALGVDLSEGFREPLLHVVFER